MRTRFIINGLMWFYKHPIITGCLLLSLSAFGLVKLLQAGYTKALDVDGLKTNDAIEKFNDGILSNVIITEAPKQTAEDRIQKLKERAKRRQKLKHEHGDEVCFIDPNIKLRNQAEDDIDRDLFCGKQDGITLNTNSTHVHFQGKNINFIRFRVIMPIKSLPPFEYGEYAYIMRPTLKSVDLAKGKTGHIEHYFSRMCVNIQSESISDPPNKSPLVYLENCDQALGTFIFQNDGLLKHNVSGKCVSPKDETDPPNTTPLVITDSCIAHFEVMLDGLIRHVESKKCIHPLGGGSHPSIGQELCLYPDCEQADRLKYRWFSPPESAPYVDITHQMDQDFSEIETISGDDHTKYDYNLMINHKKEPSEIISDDENDYPDNVIVFMFDEITSAQFYRKMKQTKNLLLKKMEAFNFNKHTLVSPIFQKNFKALLFGKKQTKKSLFDQFSKRGYMTLLNIDRPSAIDEEMRKKLKVHHDSSLFWDVAYKKYNFGISPYCLGLQPIFYPSFNYLKSFLQIYKSSKKFGVMGLSEITRGNSNGISHLDKYLAGFIENELLTLKNTVIVFTSSKGSKSGSYSKTDLGKLEAKLPLLTIWASEDRVKKLSLPDVKKNINYVTTPYDVYETLTTLIDVRGDIESDFNVLGHLRDRDCEKADIPAHLCPCG